MPTVFEAHKKSAVKNKAPIIKTNLASAKAGLFVTFSRNPEGIRFETQADKEVVVLFLRQHLIVLAPQIILGLLLLFAPPFLLPFVTGWVQNLPVALSGGYLVIGVIFWYVAIFGFLLSTFLHWFFNIYIVTNERVVDIDFINLLFKEFSEAELGKIEDLTFTAKGLGAAIFNYGDVLIQTAGEVPNIEFLRIPQPNEVVKVISGLIKEQKVGRRD